MIIFAGLLAACAPAPSEPVARAGVDLFVASETAHSETQAGQIEAVGVMAERDGALELLIRLDAIQTNAAPEITAVYGLGTPFPFQSTGISNSSGDAILGYIPMSKSSVAHFAQSGLTLGLKSGNQLLVLDVSKRVFLALLNESGV